MLSGIQLSKTVVAWQREVATVIGELLLARPLIIAAVELQDRRC
jgi:hypothetical protein